MLPGGATIVFGIAQTPHGQTTTVGIATDHGGIMNLFGTTVGGIIIGAKQIAQIQV